MATGIAAVAAKVAASSRRRSRCARFRRLSIFFVASCLCRPAACVDAEGIVNGELALELSTQRISDLLAALGQIPMGACMTKVLAKLTGTDESNVAVRLRSSPPRLLPDFEKVASTNSSDQCPCYQAFETCLDVSEVVQGPIGDDNLTCYENIRWAQETGIRAHPDWYRGLSAASSLYDFQLVVASSRGPKMPGKSWGCPLPCSGACGFDRVSTGSCTPLREEFVEILFSITSRSETADEIIAVLANHSINEVAQAIKEELATKELECNVTVKSSTWAAGSEPTVPLSYSDEFKDENKPPAHELLGLVWWCWLLIGIALVGVAALAAFIFHLKTQEDEEGSEKEEDGPKTRAVDFHPRKPGDSFQAEQMGAPPSLPLVAAPHVYVPNRATAGPMPAQVAMYAGGRASPQYSFTSAVQSFGTLPLTSPQMHSQQFSGYGQVSEQLPASTWSFYTEPYGGSYHVPVTQSH